MSGVGSSDLFPDLGGLCSEISLRYSSAYIETAPNLKATQYMSGLADEVCAKENDHPKVGPKRETVRVSLPPKPSASPTIKLPSMSGGGPSRVKRQVFQHDERPKLPPPPKKEPNAEVNETDNKKQAPRVQPDVHVAAGSSDGIFDSYKCTVPSDYFVFENWRKLGADDAEPNKGNAGKGSTPG